MEQKDIKRLAKRYKADSNNISKIYGCYVNAGQIISFIDQDIGCMEPEEQELYYGLLKKVLSGKKNNNLLDVTFDTMTVAEGGKHYKRLKDLRDSRLTDEEARAELYKTINDAMRYEEGFESYVILLSQEDYDIPARSEDCMGGMDSETVHNYFVCAICEVKDGQEVLCYQTADRLFHRNFFGHVAKNCKVGFMYPALCEDGTDIYAALYHVEKGAQVYPDLVAALFGSDTVTQSEEIQSGHITKGINSFLCDDMTFETVRDLHTEVLDKESQAEMKVDQTMMQATVFQVADMLREAGLDESHVSAFEGACADQLGDTTTVNLSAVFNTKKVKIASEGGVVISCPADSLRFVSEKIVEGRRFLVVPMDGSLSVDNFAMYGTGAEGEKNA